MDHLLESSLQLSSQIKNTQYALVDRANTADHNDFGGSKAQLVVLQSQYHKLKHSMIEGLSKLSFVEGLQSNSWPDQTQAEEDLTGATKDLQVLKAEASLLKETIQDLSVKAQTLLEEAQGKLAEFDERVNKFQEKKLRYKEQVEMHQKLCHVMQTKHATCTEVQQTLLDRKKKLEDLGMAIAKTEGRFQQFHSDIETWRNASECTAVKLKQNSEQLEKVREKLHQKLAGVDQERKWYEELLLTLRQLSGIKHHQVNAAKKQVSFQFLPESDHPECNLHLTVTFRSGQYGGNVLHHAEVNLELPGVEDLIRTAVSKNDLQFLISHISAIWRTESELVQDIAVVRDRYAVDWLQSEGVLRVMYGWNGQIICSLAVPKADNKMANIILLSVEGTNQPLDVESVKPAKEKPKLSEWLEFLQDYFGSS